MKTARKSSSRSPKTESEASIQKRIGKYLSLRSIPFAVTDAARCFGRDGQPRQRVHTGWPDISAVLPGGHAFFIETKSQSGRLRPSQVIVHDALRKQGAAVLVARSVWDVHSFLNDYLNAH